MCIRDSKKAGILERVKNIVSGSKEVKTLNTILEEKSNSDEVGVLATKDEDIRSLRAVSYTHLWWCY